MLETFLSVVYVLVCLFLIMVVLLQQGRGGGMGGAFGGSSQTVFGSSGAGNFLTRLTTISAALFMILSAALAYLSSASASSLDRELEAIEERNRTALLEAATESAEDDDEDDDGEAATPEGEPAEDGEPPAEPPPGSDELVLPGALGDLELEPGEPAGEAPDLGDVEALELELPTSLDELPSLPEPTLRLGGDDEEEDGEAPPATDDADEEPNDEPAPTAPAP